jgi:molecular chaperone HscB
MGSFTIDLQDNYFQLFAQDVLFRINVAQLDQSYRTLQAQVHPDKHVHLSATEQRVAMQGSTQVNEAYQTLRNPLRRARYLLSLQSIDTEEETNTAMPADFLMAQMEWREAIDEATQDRAVSVLDTLTTKLQQETQTLETQLAVMIDDEHHYQDAAVLVRKLHFLQKLAEALHSAYDIIEIDN